MSSADFVQYRPSSPSKKRQGGREMENALGLVMTGGGARGAYQAGVLKRIGELKRVRAQGNPFPIVSGSSAGAINGSAIAAGSGDFSLATNVIARLWSELQPADVFRCDLVSQASNSLTWILDLSEISLLTALIGRVLWSRGYRKAPQRR